MKEKCTKKNNPNNKKNPLKNKENNCKIYLTPRLCNAVNLATILSIAKTGIPSS